MDAESVGEAFFSLLEKIAAGKKDVQLLTNYMKEVEVFCNREEMELREFLEEVFPDVICEDVHEIINDSDWRSDEVGSNCISNPEILRELYPILTQIDQNTELIFATNPHTPSEIVIQLVESDYSWEEDSTTSCLARNTSDPQVLKKLANNSNSSTRYSLAINPNSPHDLLQLLAADEEFSEHLLYMAFDGGMSPYAIDVAEEMMKCSIKFALLQNPNTPIEIISQFAEAEHNFDAKTNLEYFDSEKANVNLRFKQEAEKILKSRLNLLD